MGRLEKARRARCLQHTQGLGSGGDEKDAVDYGFNYEEEPA